MVRKNPPVNSKINTLLSIFIVFFKIGAFTWGGGYAMLPLIKNEVIEKKRWITSEDFIDGIAVAQSVPGAIAINTATFIGNKVCGDLGSIMAVLGAVLPSLIAIIVVAAFFSQFGELTIVQNFFQGGKPGYRSTYRQCRYRFGERCTNEVERNYHYSRASIFTPLF